MRDLELQRIRRGNAGHLWIHNVKRSFRYRYLSAGSFFCKRREILCPGQTGELRDERVRPGPHFDTGARGSDCPIVAQVHRKRKSGTGGQGYEEGSLSDRANLPHRLELQPPRGPMRMARTKEIAFGDCNVPSGAMIPRFKTKSLFPAFRNSTMNVGTSERPSRS